MRATSLRLSLCPRGIDDRAAGAKLRLRARPRDFLKQMEEVYL